MLWIRNNNIDCPPINNTSCRLYKDKITLQIIAYVMTDEFSVVITDKFRNPINIKEKPVPKNQAADSEVISKK